MKKIPATMNITKMSIIEKKNGKLYNQYVKAIIKLKIIIISNLFKVFATSF
ncbi:hypothetical protein BCD_1267 (plasmid) [Borrelia crocidurae DOU]|uniref:Uncharacterized protein n=1 Tax=Borrelia crocidurae DOU TaxID=1293575 RepID=W5SL04_9SPIR|nr:hypothetical protein BCD_1267 [Borrelia crocidurae DOU]